MNNDQTIPGTEIDVETNQFNADELLDSMPNTAEIIANATKDVDVQGNAELENLVSSFEKINTNKHFDKSNTVRMKTGIRRKSPEDIKKQIETIDLDIEKRKESIKLAYQQAADWVVKGRIHLSKTEKWFSKKKVELLHAESDSKDGKTALIEFHQIEIARLNKELESGEYTGELSERYNETLAKLTSTFNKKVTKINRDWFLDADHKINVIIRGIYPPGETKKHAGMEEKLAERENARQGLLDTLDRMSKEQDVQVDDIIDTMNEEESSNLSQLLNGPNEIDDAKNTDDELEAILHGTKTDAVED